MFGFRQKRCDASVKTRQRNAMAGFEIHCNILWFKYTFKRNVLPCDVNGTQFGDQSNPFFQPLYAAASCGSDSILIDRNDLYLYTESSEGNENDANTLKTPMRGICTMPRTVHPVTGQPPRWSDDEELDPPGLSPWWEIGRRSRFGCGLDAKPVDGTTLFGLTGFDGESRLPCTSRCTVPCGRGYWEWLGLRLGQLVDFDFVSSLTAMIQLCVPTQQYQPRHFGIGHVFPQPCWHVATWSLHSGALTLVPLTPLVPVFDLSTAYSDSLPLPWAVWLSHLHHSIAVGPWTCASFAMLWMRAISSWCRLCMSFMSPTFNRYRVGPSFMNNFLNSLAHQRSQCLGLRLAAQSGGLAGQKHLWKKASDTHRTKQRSPLSWGDGNMSTQFERRPEAVQPFEPVSKLVMGGSAWSCAQSFEIPCKRRELNDNTNSKWHFFL